MAVRIVIADDHAIVRQGLKNLLDSKGCNVIAEASDGLQAVKLCQELQPDVVVLDLSMPLLNGIDATREIQKVCPRTKAIVLSMHKEENFVLGSLRAGASAYLLKSEDPAEVLTAIKQVIKGAIYLSPEISGTVVQAYLRSPHAPADPLSSRERQILQLVAEGGTSKEIARQLCISAKTVERHRLNIMEKLDIHDTAGLVRYAIQKGLIQS